MMVNGKARIYLVFPAFARMPLIYLLSAGRGVWSRFCQFCAGIVALAAFAGLLHTALRSSALSTRWQKWMGGACLVGFVFGFLFCFLSEAPLFKRTILWESCLVCGLSLFRFAIPEVRGRALMWSLLAFSFCAGAALLSRPTFGAPFLLIAVLLGIQSFQRRSIRNLAALCCRSGLRSFFTSLLLMPNSAISAGCPWPIRSTRISVILL